MLGVGVPVFILGLLLGWSEPVLGWAITGVVAAVSLVWGVVHFKPTLRR